MRYHPNNHGNDFLNFYGEHNISPIRQNIDDLSLHYERRRKLYRQCGIPYRTLENANILEVGPGSGYNSLFFLHIMKKGHLDLVEPNVCGVEDIKKLFYEHRIDESLYTLYNTTIEKFSEPRKYDVIIAEGFLQYLNNQDEVILELKKLAKDHCIIVVTCTDHTCMFIEGMKRLIAHVITSDIYDFDDKVERLVEVFAPQLKNLRGMSRSAEDWVKDQILNPAGINGNELTMAEAIEKFTDDYFVLGSSPTMFTDYSWYKDVWINHNEKCIEQFNKKRLSLLMADMNEAVLPLEQVDKLTDCFRRIKFWANEYEITNDANLITMIIQELYVIKDNTDGLPYEFFIVLQEIIDIFEVIIRNNEVVFSSYPHFFASFGRTLQYIAFEKR